MFSNAKRLPNYVVHPLNMWMKPSSVALRSHRSDSGRILASSPNTHNNTEKGFKSGSLSVIVVAYFICAHSISCHLALLPYLWQLWSVACPQEYCICNCSTINTLITAQAVTQAKTNNTAVLTRVLLSGFGSGFMNRTKQLVPDWGGLLFSPGGWFKYIRGERSRNNSGNGENAIERRNEWNGKEFNHG